MKNPLFSNKLFWNFSFLFVKHFLFLREKLKITLFRTLLQKEKHVGTLFFHIFVIILAERVIKLCIFFSFPIKPATVVWIGFMKKRGKFPYFGIYSPWSCKPGPSETGSSVIPPPQIFADLYILTLFESRGSGWSQITPITLLLNPPDFQIFLRHCTLIIKNHRSKKYTDI